ncbi:(2,3-dihydroxybenzoyl)adenylate synthase [Rhizobium sp. L1K21]|uniref:(2,3-dihydroxybenzoyl)adenylate synthase n=1 Tax=Rhizobium sp. L1K21 TaxID=2954933 RepID=UPI00209203CB|nr:(2,3-dihydroxybenzoyl)adenylate synthase [Rhizobium sp. L1K21]MCO6187571.1 (2,3-dihydroxybenzoyl)adenylate synthase [Rhizobium sp. L1K21]
MTIEYSRWPEPFAARYRQKGYWIDEPLSRLIEKPAAETPDATAIICGERHFTYAQVNEKADNLAFRLAASGLSHGDTALVQLPNVAEFYIVFFALLKIGVAPLNALFSHRKLELNAYAGQIKPKLLIASREHALFADDSFVEALREQAPDLATIIFHGEKNRQTSLEHWLEPSQRQETGSVSPTAADEVAFFQLSGGSTGTPKLIPRTHNDYDYSVRASAEICALTRESRFLCCLPAGHNYPLSSPGAFGIFHAGGCVVLAANPEPLNCFEIIKRHQVSIAALVPSAVILWLQAATEHRASLGSLKLLQVGGASFADSLARQVPEVLGCKLQQVFGMAEGLVNYTRLDDPDHLVFQTQGRPISPDDEIKILSEDGTPVEAGQPGMLATRGPYTFRGYYQSPEHNKEVFDADGFYYSGDVVQQTEEGYLRVVGRVKDQINRGGEKVAAEEIEHLLLLHPDVESAALVAMQDTLLGEKSCAFVVSSNANPKALLLKRHLLNLGIAEYKLPDRIRFIDALPLTPVGKTDKKKLRMLLSQQNEHIKTI